MKKQRTIEDDLKELKEKDLLKEEELFFSLKAKRIMVVFSSILMIFLIASFIYIKFPIFGVLLGQTQSRPLQGNVLDLKGVKVYLEGDSLNEVLSTYENNPSVETSLCLEGFSEGNEYFIMSAYVPEIISQSYNHITHESCSADTIILFHTHPYKSCLASDMDLETLKRNQISKPKTIMIIMCEPNRFSLYN